MAELFVERDKALSPLTSLELGGSASAFVRVSSEERLIQALEWAREQEMPAAILGGGSNIIVPDQGFPGLVIQMGMEGIEAIPEGEYVRLRVQAGERWDDVVRFAVERGLAGIECLSGIPGLAGATPIQNVGAYGQEIADTLDRVRLVERESLEVVVLPASSLGLTYRDSALKRDPSRYVVIAIELLLRPHGTPTLRYGELATEVAGSRGGLTLAETRQAVLRLRRRKSMVIDPVDPNRRSAGSFFTNPILSDEDAERVIRTAVEAGLVGDASDVPRYPGGPGRTKLAAAWLIEKSGVKKGERRGSIGVSTAHTLSLVHHGGGTAEALLAFADEVAAKVEVRFGVRLEREPVLLCP